MVCPKRNAATANSSGMKNGSPSALNHWFPSVTILLTIAGSTIRLR